MRGHFECVASHASASSSEKEYSWSRTRAPIPHLAPPSGKYYRLKGFLASFGRPGCPILSLLKGDHHEHATLAGFAGVSLSTIERLERGAKVSLRTRCRSAVQRNSSEDDGRTVVSTAGSYPPLARADALSQI